MSAEIHVGDIGTVFEVTVKDEDGVVVNLSAATLKQIIFEKADGSTLTKTAAFVTDGTDGKLKYTTILGDLSVKGDWKLQVYVELSAGKWHSDLQSFEVIENIS